METVDDIISNESLPTSGTEYRFCMYIQMATAIGISEVEAQR